MPEHPQKKTPHGRGITANPQNRFETIAYIPDEGETFPTGTQLFRDASKTVISYNNSPDIPYNASLNPYRGCEHGCSYCYARPYHEYLGFSAGLDFETKIMVKEDAPNLLRKELSSPRWKPQNLNLSGVTDPYQPLERQLAITRGCLEVLVSFQNPVTIVTKNALVTRDIDLLQSLAKVNAAIVIISMTSLENAVCNVMEPRTSRPQQRLKAIRTLSDAGIPVGVLVSPIIPGLTDHEIPAILDAVKDAGADFAEYTMLRLPHGVADIFSDWLELHFPERKEKILNRVRDIRQGALNDTKFRRRMQGQGIFAEQIQSLFRISCDRLGLPRKAPNLSITSFRRSGEQLNLL
ncbi:MAG TPA: radical SAM protein [Candidatus Marinimicrobia bacterium]|nr:MAG: radical SAM protein [Candidatus Marinimicrobia bacterium CG1_02_48_14]HCW75853.1 radical SAM protein [Candidatus Neomarinimicrobiota bacterium]